MAHHDAKAAQSDLALRLLLRHERLVLAKYCCNVASSEDLARLLTAIATSDDTVVKDSLDAAPVLARASVTRGNEFFITECLAQVYEGDTALHAAAFSYDAEIARNLVAHGADVRARNRRGAEPLHAAVFGGPGAPMWNPVRQRAVIEYLVDAGADPNAEALGGITPLHRAVRNRCSLAVETLLRLGADPGLANGHGSTPAVLARWTTGRGGVGSEAAKIEQQIIIDLLKQAVS